MHRLYRAVVEILARLPLDDDFYSIVRMAIAVAATVVVLVVDFGGDFAVDTMTAAHLDT